MPSGPKAYGVGNSEVLGAATVFKQGGSLRLIIPKKASAYLKIPRDPEESEYPTVVLVATEKGILLRPLSDLLEDEGRVR